MHFVNVVTIKPVDRSYEDDEDRIEIDRESKNEVKEVENDKEKEVEDVEDYFDRLPTKEERAYHRDLFDDPETPYFLGSPIIKMGDQSNINIPCNSGHVHVWKAYIDRKSPLNIMTRIHYNWIMKSNLDLGYFLTYVG